MDAASRGLLMTYLCQALVGLAQAGIFAYFHRIYRQNYLRYWTWAFATLCVYEATAAVTAYLAIRTPGALAERTVWAWLSQMAAYLQVCWLILGSLSVGRAKPISPTIVRRVILAALSFATAVTLMFAFSPDGAMVRVSLRVGLRFAACGLAFLLTATVLWRQRRELPGLGLRFVSVAFALYGLMLLQELGFFAWQIWRDQRLPGTEFLGLLDLVAQACIGFGLIIWVADDERQRADRATRETAVARNFDSSTGLPNRAHAIDLIGADLQSDAPDTVHAVLAIDMPELDAVARSYGAAEVERVMAQVAQRLLGFAPAPSRVARVYAHRFVLSLAQADDGETLAALAQRLEEQLQRPYEMKESPLSLRAAIGIAVSPGDGKDAQVLIDRAEAAAQDSDTALSFYNAERADAARRSLAFGESVREGLAAGQFTPYFQPIVNAVRHEVVGFEVLARWRHPQRDLLLPADFLDALEKRNLLQSLDAKLLHEACAWAAAQAANGVAISVNVSAHALDAPDFNAATRRALESSGLDPRLLQIEITESTALADSPRTRAALATLRRDHIRVALDDFGVGYSSLAQLRDLAVDTVKIDRSFVQAVLHDSKTAAIVDAMVTLARKLGLDVVAEGVEKRAEVDYFEALGITHLQGWYFGVAMPAGQASGLIGRRLLPGVSPVH
jgi:predicted signal transduction protein with EAL and GGDEF domain